MCYRTETYTVCKRVRASFSPEMLQAGAVKGLKLLSSLPILMRESFWWWQCSDRYIISLPPSSLTYIRQSLTSLIVSVDVKHHERRKRTPLFPHIHSLFLNKPCGFCGRNAPWEKKNERTNKRFLLINEYNGISTIRLYIQPSGKQSKQNINSKWKHHINYVDYVYKLGWTCNLAHTHTCSQVSVTRPHRELIKQKHGMHKYPHKNQ